EPDSDPATSVEAADWESKGEQRLANAMQSLDERSRDILHKRWIREPKVTLQELADEYSVSAERIRQLENNAIRKLRGLIAT
ncbi:MAG: sigma factor-like helix-turn-helix DNA-binding protein, partial [Gammaproteobacteria bacterium]